MTLEKMTGVRFMLVLFLAGRFLRRGRRIIQIHLCICRHQVVAFLVFEPVGGGAEAGACCHNIGDENRQQHVNKPRFDAQQMM